MLNLGQAMARCAVCGVSAVRAAVVGRLLLETGDTLVAEDSSYLTTEG